MMKKALISIQKEGFTLEELIDALICVRSCDTIPAESYTNIVNTASYERITEIHAEIDDLGKIRVIFS